MLLVYLLAAGWFASVVLMLVNFVLIPFLETSLRFKTVHMSIWACYTLPAITLWLAGQKKIPADFIPAGVAITCALVIPFITICHSIFLFSTRRKLRLASPS